MHLGTGFLATPLLLPVLADTGHLDVAYRPTDAGHRAVLAGDDRPRRDHDVGTLGRRGARRGAVGISEPLLQGCGDLVPGPLQRRYRLLLDGHPGYQQFRVQPRPGGGLTWAEAAHDSPYGRIESAWRMDGERLRAARCRPRRHARRRWSCPTATTATADPGEHTHRCTVAHELLEAAR